MVYYMKSLFVNVLTFGTRQWYYLKENIFIVIFMFKFIFLALLKISQDHCDTNITHLGINKVFLILSHSESITADAAF